MSDESAGASRKTSKKLGRGLSALLGDEDEDTAELDKLRQTRTLPVERMAPGPFQPRRRFGEDELNELAESIREQGLLQPILVRRDPDSENYQIIAGERRWRAAQLAQVHEVPVLVREFDDRTAMEISLVENVQRQDLSPLEEAQGYRRLAEDYGHAQDAIARAVGKSRSHVANMMRLLQLPDEVCALIDDGQLTAGHARALLGAEDPAALAREVVTRKLNVRETEKLVQKEKQGDAPAASRPKKSAGKDKDGDTRILEEDLTDRLGLKVEIDHSASKGSGAVTIRYGDLEQLDLIVERLSGAPGGSAGQAPEAGPNYFDADSDSPDEGYGPGPDGWAFDDEDDEVDTTEERPNFGLSGKKLAEAERDGSEDDDDSESSGDDDFDADDPLMPKG